MLDTRIDTCHCVAQSRPRCDPLCKTRREDGSMDLKEVRSLISSLPNLWNKFHRSLARNSHLSKVSVVSWQPASSNTKNCTMATPQTPPPPTRTREGDRPQTRRSQARLLQLWYRRLLVSLYTSQPTFITYSTYWSRLCSLHRRDQTRSLFSRDFVFVLSSAREFLPARSTFSLLFYHTLSSCLGPRALSQL